MAMLYTRLQIKHHKSVRLSPNVPTKLLIFLRQTHEPMACRSWTGNFLASHPQLFDAIGKGIVSLSLVTESLFADVDEWRWEESDTSALRVISIPEPLVEQFQEELDVDIPIETSFDQFVRLATDF